MGIRFFSSNTRPFLHLKQAQSVIHLDVHLPSLAVDVCTQMTERVG